MRRKEWTGKKVGKEEREDGKKITRKERRGKKVRNEERKDRKEKYYKGSH